MREPSLVASSLRAAWRDRRLALLLWLLTFALSLLAIAPIAATFDSLLAQTPEADSFLTRFSLPLFSDLMESEAGAFSALRRMLGSFVVLSCLLNTFAAGGALEVLLYPDSRSLAVRFARGGGRNFGRFLRAGLVAIPVAAAFGGLLSAPVWMIRGALSFRAEAAKFFLGIAGGIVGAVGVLVVLLALDLARIRIARTDSRRAVRIFLRTLLQVLRRPLPALGLWLALALPLAVLGFVVLAAGSRLPASSGALLLLLLVLQQLPILARAFFRVALWSGEIRLASIQASSSLRIGKSSP